MRVRYGEKSIPYPLHVLNGNLRLCGLNEEQIAALMMKVRMDISHEIPTFAELNQLVLDSLSTIDKTVLDNFQVLLGYQEQRMRNASTPPLILVLEGSSATGKSMLSLPLIEDLGATRVLSTDTVRQVLRSIHSDEQMPELFCHTYQAYKFAVQGPEDLDPVVRGFIAQQSRMLDTLTTSIQRYIDEGTMAIIEGVHLIPGQLQQLSNGVLEVLINPDENLHRDMFLLKHEASGLSTVSSDRQVRLDEFRATRKIQDYLVKSACSSGVAIIEIDSYEDALDDVHRIIMRKLRDLARQSSSEQQ
jgi:2-phosphoglycerate kinase